MTLNQDCVSVEEARKLISDPRYVVDEFIGAGAMACVYKVYERGTPNVYALKLLREQYWQRDRFKEIFEREAQHMRDLQYPNIVRFYKFVADENSAYILMDFVEGKPLTSVIREVRATGDLVPLDKIVRIMAQIARAISYLHAEGFIHRDIKPGNILLTGQDESAFLTDLGIAGAIDEPSMSGAGTPSYMPYEQQTRGKIDQKVDVYAFGIMLYELFTGQKPFQPSAGLAFNEARKEMVELHRKAKIPNISEKRDDLPVSIDQYFHRALAKNPDERYGDILDFAKDIHEDLRNHLPDDLHNFDNIQAQAMTRSATSEDVAPVVVTVTEPSRLDYRVIAGGVVTIIIIIALMVVLLRTNSNIGDVTPSEPVVLIEATNAESIPTPTISESIDPFLLAEDVEAIGYLDDLNRSIQYVASVRDGIVPLVVNDSTRQFSVSLQLQETISIGEQQIGLLFDFQDMNNFMRFQINGATSQWQLAEIVNGDTMILQSSALDSPLPLEWILSVADNLITVEFDDTRIEQAYTDTIEGDIALWMPLDKEGATLAVEMLSVSLLGVDATLARNSDFSSPPLPDTLSLLQEDIETLANTGDETAVVDCVIFNRVYGQLDAHRVIDGADTIIDDVQTSSTVVASQCQLESDNDAVEFSFSDYLSWDDALNAIINDLENE